MDQMSQKTYDFIIQYKRDHDGNSPGREEISQAIGLRSRSGVNEYLARLVALGLITLGGRGQAKAIYVVGGKWTLGSSVDPLPQIKENRHERDSTWDEEMGIEDWGEEVL